MPEFIANSETSLQAAIGELRDLWRENRFLRIKATPGKKRSLDQNALAHAWYEQVARELREDDALGVKCYCKLHHGVPILRAEDADFRSMYDAGLKGMTYPQKLVAMKFLPVTSHMTKQQLSAYLEAVRDDFRQRGVALDFPVDAAA